MQSNESSCDLNYCLETDLNTVSFVYTHNDEVNELPKEAVNVQTADEHPFQSMTPPTPSILIMYRFCHVGAV